MALILVNSALLRTSLSSEIARLCFDGVRNLKTRSFELMSRSYSLLPCDCLLAILQMLLVLRLDEVEELRVLEKFERLDVARGL